MFLQKDDSFELQTNSGKWINISNSNNALIINCVIGSSGKGHSGCIYWIYQKHFSGALFTLTDLRNAVI